MTYRPTYTLIICPQNVTLYFWQLLMQEFACWKIGRALLFGFGWMCTPRNIILLLFLGQMESAPLPALIILIVNYLGSSPFICVSLFQWALLLEGYCALEGMCTFIYRYICYP